VASGPGTARRPGDGLLSIGDLARATRTAPDTLRAWERRHGFPQPLRADGGHRRYTEWHVSAVREVRRRRSAGIRLDVAISQVRAELDGSARPSVFAAIRARHAGQPHQLWRTPSLLALSLAIEDEVAAGAGAGHLFGGFQTEPHYAAALPRWTGLAQRAASTHVFVHLDDAQVPRFDGHSPGEPTRIGLPASSPLVREWLVVHDAPDVAVALVALELPGRPGSPRRDRVFETIWTVDRTVVREAARRCAETAAVAGSRQAAELLIGPLAAPPPEPAQPRLAERLVHRMVGHLDDVWRPRST
jgi:DNA-binding transcriptional MerR regulator